MRFFTFQSCCRKVRKAVVFRGMTDIFFYDVPVYRLFEAEYYRQREEFIEKTLYPPSDPLTATTRRALKAKDPNAEDFMRDHLAKAYGGPWRFNEIVGFIRLHFLGAQIRGEYWATEAKRIVRTRHKVFEWKTWKLAPERELPANATDAEIFAAVKGYLLACEKELKGRFIDRELLEVIGPRLDWRSFFGR